jgi:hypothetical protein
VLHARKHIGEVIVAASFELADLAAMQRILRRYASRSFVVVTLTILSHAAVGRDGDSSANPYLALLERFALESDSIKVRTEPAHASSFNVRAEALDSAAHALCLDKTQRATYLPIVVSGIDSLIKYSRDGDWWQLGRRGSDPNLNRFVLAPLLDAIHALKSCGLMSEDAWDSWKTDLKAAVELQRAARRGEVPWDWGGRIAGLYPNQDAYAALILELASLLFHDSDLRTEAESIVSTLAARQSEGGAFHYIGEECESPLYNSLTAVVLARYYSISRSEQARRILRAAAKYWPNVLSDHVQPEFWTDVWWKQSWTFRPTGVLTILSNISGDQLINFYARQQLRAYSALKKSYYVNFEDLVAKDWWPPSPQITEPPRRRIWLDRNVHGVRGRNESWYYGVAKGCGLRNTFVGALISEAGAPLSAALRGVNIGVTESDARNELWLSELKDDAKVMQIPDRGGVLCTTYSVQPSMYHPVPTKSSSKNHWIVRQFWEASADGIIGAVTITSTKQVKHATVSGRILLGPQPIERRKDGRWVSGTIAVKIFESFGKTEVKALPASPNGGTPNWDGIILSISGPVRANESFTYVVWVGPTVQQPPVHVSLLGKSSGWWAKWPNGRESGLLFPARDELIEVPVKKASFYSLASGQLGLAAHKESGRHTEVGRDDCVAAYASGK